jgi:acylphosphatase
MPVKIRSMSTNPNGTVVVSLSFPDSELDRFLEWYGGNGKKRRSPAASRKAVRTRRKNAAAK